MPAFSHDATLGSREMMARKYRVLSFGPRIVPGVTSGDVGSCTMLPHTNDVILCQLMDGDDASISHWMASFACAMSSSPLLPLGSTHSRFSGLRQSHGFVFCAHHVVCCEDGKTEVCVCVWLSGDGGRKGKKGEERASFGFVSRFVKAL